MTENNSRTDTVKKYFNFQNNADMESVVDLFENQTEVYNVNFPVFKGIDGVRLFCEGLYSRTSKRKFEILEISKSKNKIMVEWQTKLTFRAGIKIAQWQVSEPFEAEFGGVNVFEFLPGSNKIKCLRIYHETSTVAQLAQLHSKN